MKIENFTELFKTVMDDFNDQFASDFNAENIILQGISLNENYEKIFEEFCKKYFPHRLNDDYKTIEYYSFFASAFTGKTPYEKNGILVRTDKDISVKEMYHILYHELAHVYCVHKELDGKNFYDEYCENYAKDRVTDGQINAGYAVWRELISETIAIDCDEEYRRNFLIEKEK